MEEASLKAYQEYLKTESDTFSQLLDKIKIKTVAHSDPLGVRGITNNGNTCFFNSGMQNLLHTHFLKAYLEYFEESQFPEYTNKDMEFKRDAPYTLALKSFFEGYYQTSADQVFDPKDSELFKLLRLKKPRGLELNQGASPIQEDAEEFISSLLNKLKEEYTVLTKNQRKTAKEGLVKIAPSKIFTDQNFAFKQAFFSFFVNNSSSTLNDILDPFFVFNNFFEKRLSYKDKDTNQDLEKLVLEPILIYTLSLPKEESKLEDLFKFQVVAVEDYKQSTTRYAQQRDEYILPGNISFATKNHPSYLVIQLSRFLYDAVGSKNDVAIEYPEKFTRNGIRYELYGVSHQSGSLNGGHYWASVKDGDEWFTLNDSRVSKVSDVFTKPENKKTAYLLFYRTTPIAQEE